MKIIKLVLLALLFSCTTSSNAVEIYSWNKGWKFGRGWESQHKNGMSVDLPHTWNAEDAMFGNVNYYRGMCCYSKKLQLPDKYRGKRVFLKINAAQTVADVYIDNHFVMNHKGGYTAFVAELTDWIVPGKEHQIDIRVNNAQTMETAPICGDFNIYGGLYRGVDLLITEDACIDPAFFASSGVLVNQRNVSGKSAELHITTLLSSKHENLADCELQVMLKDKEKIVGRHTSRLADGINNEKTMLKVKSPHLWDGINDPYQYRLEVLLLKDGREIDRREELIGIRYWNGDADKGFLLNGMPYNLHGVNMHQDRAERASAYHPDDYEEDLDLVEEMGCNAIRLCHYPQDKYLHTAMDRRGLVAWVEIPFVNVFVNNPDYSQNLLQQLTELIYQNYNHAAILSWGLFNEINGGWMEDPNPMVRRLIALAKELDPDRPVVGASNQIDEFNGYTDYIAYNRYFGWYGDNFEEMGKWIDDQHQKHPERIMGISEYGAGGCVYQQSDSLVHPEPWGQWHPENWQTLYHIENWKQLKQRPFLWCNFIWCMFDFGAAGRREGTVFGRNDKGMVSYDRKTKKDAFYFYKANWNSNEKFLYIAAKRNNERTTADTSIQVFSNCGPAELFINGKSMGSKTPDDVNVIIWPDITLNKGSNQISVKNSQCSDSCIWTLKSTPTL